MSILYYTLNNTILYYIQYIYIYVCICMYMSWAFEAECRYLVFVWSFGAPQMSDM